MNCARCGRELADEAAFCPACGQAKGAAHGPVLAENLSGFLCYVLGWLSGLCMLFIDRRPFVRRHAAQSIVLFGGLSVLKAALVFLGVFPGCGLAWGLGGCFLLGRLLSGLLTLLMAALWIVCMVKAYQGKPFRVPLAAELADRLAASNL